MSSPLYNPIHPQESQPPTLEPEVVAENGHTHEEPRPRSSASVSVVAERLRSLEHPSPDSPSTERPRRVRSGWVFAAAAIVAAGALLGGGVYTVIAPEDPYKGLELQPADRGKIILSIIEKGELEAAKNTDIVCKVRAKSPSNSIATSVRWLVEDGTRVKKGDLIIQLDDSGLKDQLKSQESLVAEKRSSLIQAEKEKLIVDSQNRSDLQSAMNNVKLCEIDLEKYLKGELEQKQKDVIGRIMLAESDLMQWKDKEAWSSRMVKRGYVSPSQAQSDEAKRRGAEISLEKLNEEKRVLNFYDARRNELDYRNKLSQAIEAEKVAEIQAEAKVAQAISKIDAATSTLSTEESKLEDLKMDIRNCTVRAPNDGMVVYVIPEGSRFGTSSNQNVIGLGEPVREGQKMMRIPDLSKMQVKVKVHEALVPRLRGDVLRRTYFGESLLAGLAATHPGPDLVCSTIAAQEVRTWFADLEDEIVEEGLPAKIKIASLDQPLRGHVRSVSAVASSTDWMSSDVKVYPTVVVIDELVDGLKPGMSAEVTIGISELENALRLPVHAVLEAGGKKFCYVKPQSGAPEKRMLITGLNNNKFVEIKEGSELKEGELVVMNPRALAEKLGDLQVDYRDPGEGLNPPDAKKDSRSTAPAPTNGSGDPSKAERPIRRGGPGGANGSPAAGPSTPGGPVAGPGGAGAPGGGRPQMSEEQRNQMLKFQEDMKKATPAKRKQMIEDLQVPDNVKEMIKKRMRDQGLEISD